MDGSAAMRFLLLLWAGITALCVGMALWLWIRWRTLRARRLNREAQRAADDKAAQ